ncbi:hypothetical protein B9Z55_016166 [Caenorhabditis nigoni]|nr:hypothetical protein B9Z55_016166 [Caenorhabditis nigoni]
MENVAETLLETIGSVSDATMSSIQRVEEGTVVVQCRPNSIKTVYGEEWVPVPVIDLVGHAVSKSAYHTLETDKFPWALQTNTITRTPKISPQIGEEVTFVGVAKVGGEILDPILQFEAWVVRSDERILLATGTSSIFMQRAEIPVAPDDVVIVKEDAALLVADEPSATASETSSEAPQPKKTRIS